MRIDLHCHSTASDGTDSPAELVAAAARAGLDAVAITDHDTTAGWADAEAALPPGLTLVRGAELTCVSPDGRGGRCTVHLLAYLFDPEAETVVAEYARTRAERRSRLHTIADRMAADGYPVDGDTLLADLPDDVPAGRPHLAQALVRAGVVSSVTEAFASLLHGRNGYYVPSRRTPVLEAIEMIKSAGGVTVLAHGFAHRRGPTVNGTVIAELAEAGMDGLEVDHPDHDRRARAALRTLATRHNLLTTGSSDYHGTNKTTPIGAETTAPEMLTEIAARATGATLVHGR
ncbi:putative metal-dependent phosphoesterases (PHP family) [Actinokineospora spheciospongiae]|uniref:Putative metal-dependent phosphoesterases (PHP family) n=1 Tax=Actinokineospora spheciospongiae TaxID=909613 RepID=W7J4Z8_9PSEU|nr:PHP domain-containing protein [Actinokineospora spheciospongiae]EWC61189.1 putative metal-dependent phosphoesterases (PHP family) [Actinokineospora spheciospongiae]